MHHLPAQGGCDIHCIIQVRNEGNQNISVFICSSVTSLFLRSLCFSVTVNPEHADI
uniref:Uncharacterized protein n=1 Tax=Setaria italica TaxID=4555 RepID=K3XP79_SETIT